MWTHFAYRFASEAAWLAALATEGWEAGTPPEVSLLVTGKLAEDDETPLPGWHVAAAFRDRAPPAAWSALEIDAPAQMPVIARPPAPTLADYEAAIQAHIDATAGQRGYASGVSCASFINDPYPPWAAEAAAFIPWRSEVWRAVYARLAEVQAGAPAPSIVALVASLPAMEWPA